MSCLLDLWESNKAYLYQNIVIQAVLINALANDKLENFSPLTSSSWVNFLKYSWGVVIIYYTS